MPAQDHTLGAGDRSGDPEGDLARAIGALRAGGADEEAARVIHRRYFRAVEAYLRRRGAEPDEALDLTQETFMKVYSNIGGFRAESSFSTWVFTIARNTHLKRLQRRGSEPPVGLAGEALGGSAVEIPDREQDGPLAATLDGERRGRLRSAIRRLPPRQRQCMVARIYQERSYREIAALLSISVETVKVHLFQARKALAAFLAPSARSAGEPPAGGS